MLSLGIKTGADLLKLLQTGAGPAFRERGRVLLPARARRRRSTRLPQFGRAKSLARRETFQSDVDDHHIVASSCDARPSEVSNELKRQRLKGRTITLKIKVFRLPQLHAQPLLPRAARRRGDHSARRHLAARQDRRREGQDTSRRSYGLRLPGGRGPGERTGPARIRLQGLARPLVEADHEGSGSFGAICFQQQCSGLFRLSRHREI
jgi:hypothetical protein